VRGLVVLSIACALAACKGKPKHQEAPANAATPGSAATGERPNLVLPKGPGTPPDATKAPLTKAAIERMRGMTFDRFTTQNRGNDQSVVMVSTTVDHPKITITVQIVPCEDKCLPMDVAKWKDEPRTKEFLPKELQGAADTVFEVGATDLVGAPMIYTYQLGQKGGGEHGGASYSDMYALYFNDGHNEIRVYASYSGDLQESKDALAQLVPKSDLEHCAKAFLDVYAHAWNL
jgi:hypothetical protein